MSSELQRLLALAGIGCRKWETNLAKNPLFATPILIYNRRELNNSGISRAKQKLRRTDIFKAASEENKLKLNEQVKQDWIKANTATGAYWRVYAESLGHRANSRGKFWFEAKLVTRADCVLCGSIGHVAATCPHYFEALEVRKRKKAPRARRGQLPKPNFSSNVHGRLDLQDVAMGNGDNFGEENFHASAFGRENEESCKDKVRTGPEDTEKILRAAFNDGYDEAIKDTYRFGNLNSGGVETFKELGYFLGDYTNSIHWGLDEIMSEVVESNSN